MNMIVAYDIANPRRLLKIAKVMKDYGRRVQKSIFEVEASERHFREMKYRAECILDPDEDGVKYFPLCERCQDTLITLGRFAACPDEGDVQVI